MWVKSPSLRPAMLHQTRKERKSQQSLSDADLGGNYNKEMKTQLKKDKQLIPGWRRCKVIIRVVFQCPMGGYDMMQTYVSF